MNEMENAKTKGAKPAFSWNPLVAITDDEHAKSLARDGGVVCVGLIAAGYVLLSVVILFGGTSPYDAGSEASTTLISHAVVLAVAAFLAWRVWQRQPLWALWVVLLWIVVETVGKVLLALGGGGSFGAWSFLINVIGLIVAVQAVRGGFWLSRKRQTARRNAIKAGFDV
jgi:hypothetical protein